MANAEVVPVGPGELDLIADLYNQVFSPGVAESFFRRRFQGRHNVTMFVALLDKHHVGFILGFELMPTTFFSWLCGVLPDARRLGVATQLMQALEAYSAEHHYTTIRFECQNQHRPMLHLAISQNYDLIGVRWDTYTASNVVIFEKDLS